MFLSSFVCFSFSHWIWVEVTGSNLRVVTIRQFAGLLFSCVVRQYYLYTYFVCRYVYLPICHTKFTRQHILAKFVRNMWSVKLVTHYEWGHFVLSLGNSPYLQKWNAFFGIWSYRISNERTHSAISLQYWLKNSGVIT